MLGWISVIVTLVALVAMIGLCVVCYKYSLKVESRELDEYLKDKSKKDKK